MAMKGSFAVHYLYVLKGASQQTRVMYTGCYLCKNDLSF